MPVANINSNSKTVVGFIYPPTGKVRLSLESTLPVDVFIANNLQAGQIVSAKTAADLGLFGYLRHNFIKDEILTIPPGWIDGWKLVIGNNNAGPVAVTYSVWNA